VNLLSEEDQRQSIEGEGRLMNDPERFSPALLLLGTAKFGMPGFRILVLPLWWQTDQTGGRPGGVYIPHPAAEPRSGAGAFGRADA
jgi:hypothetical protein